MPSISVFRVSTSCSPADPSPSLTPLGFMFKLSIPSIASTGTADGTINSDSFTHWLISLDVLDSSPIKIRLDKEFECNSGWDDDSSEAAIFVFAFIGTSRAPLLCRFLTLLTSESIDPTVLSCLSRLPVCF